MYPDIVITTMPWDWGTDLLALENYGELSANHWNLLGSWSIFSLCEDLNGDAWPDLLTAREGPVYRYPGMPEMWMHRQLLQYPHESRELCASDFDEDGFKDLAVCWRGIEILRNDGITRFPLVLPSYHFGGRFDYKCILTADLNGDGHLDIVASEWKQCPIRVFFGRGDGTFPDEPEQILKAPDCSDSWVWRMRLEDIDADGLLDLVYGDRGQGIVIAWGNGTGFEAPQRLLRTTPGTVAGAFAIADADNDGHWDVFAGTYEGELYLFRGTGTRSFQQGIVIRYVPAMGNDLDAADFDLDGNVDLAFVAVELPHLLIMYGDGAGDFSRDNPIRLPGTDDPRWAVNWTAWNIQICGLDMQIVRGDANRDEKIDIADAIRILSFLFAQSERLPCPDTADANDDGWINIADPIKILSHLFGDRGDLPSPFPEAGWDFTRDWPASATDLGCSECWDPFVPAMFDLCYHEIYPDGDDDPIIIDLVAPP